MKRSRYIIIFVLCLLMTGIGRASTLTLKKVKPNKYGVCESTTVKLLSQKKQEDEKLTFKCRILRNGKQYVMHAQILCNDSSAHIVSPGVKFMLSDGDCVVLKPERDAACCSNWADGRWYNTTFKLDSDNVEKLKTSDILSVSIPLYGRKEMVRQTATGMEHSVAELLLSVAED